MGIFAVRLKLARRRAGMTQGAVAVGMKTHRNTIGRWERSKDLPALIVGCRLARFLGVNVHYLAGLVEDLTPGTQLEPEEAQFLGEYRQLTPKQKLLWRGSIEEARQVNVTASRQR